MFHTDVPGALLLGDCARNESFPHNENSYESGKRRTGVDPIPSNKETHLVAVRNTPELRREFPPVRDAGALPGLLGSRFPGHIRLRLGALRHVGTGVVVAVARR